MPRTSAAHPQRQSPTTRLRATSVLQLLLVACASGRGPHTTANALGQCPDMIPTYVGRLNQFFQGTTSSYDWVISPTTPSGQVPSGDSGCPVSSYVSQFNVGGGCAAALTQQTQAPQPTSSGCQYTFQDTQNIRQVMLALECDNSPQASNYINIIGTVSVVQIGNVYVYYMSGLTRAVCPPSSTIPATTQGPAAYSLMQIQCADPRCRHNCNVAYPPQYACQAVNTTVNPTSSSDYIGTTMHCTPSGTGVNVTVFPESPSCFGASITSQVPTGLCVPNAYVPGLYTTSYCQPAGAAQEDRRVRGRI